MADKAKTPPPPKKGPQKSAGGSKRNLRLILIIGIVAAVVVAGGLIALSQRGGTADDGANAAEVEAGKLKGTKQVQDFFAGVPQNGNTLGDPNAPVTVTEFADLRPRLVWDRSTDLLTARRGAKLLPAPVAAA